MQATPTPVTLLTGFLGSGKTTLLNHMLHHPGMDRAAVVVNEFGEVGLDHDLIESGSEATVLMASGCLCCTVRGDLGITLAGLLARRQAGELAFDRVVIETTGLADPGPILHALVLDPELTHDFALDGVVTTADAATGPATLDRQFEAVQQVAMADRIVLTKADLVSAAALARFETRLAGLNPGAPRLRADHGRLEPSHLFGIAPAADSTPAGALNWVAASDTPPRPALPPLSGLRHAATSASPLTPSQGHGLFAPGRSAGQAAIIGKATGSNHDGRITSQSAEIAQPIPAIVFDLWLESLVSSAATGILRLKAVVHVEGLDHPFALHGVQHVFHPPVPLTDWPRGDTVSRIVVIGRDLPPGYLQESLQCLHSPPPMQVHQT